MARKRQSYKPKKPAVTKSSLQGATPQWRIDQDKAWATEIAKMNARNAPKPVAAPPPDPVFEAQRAADARNVQLADASFAYQSGRLEQNFGITDKSNPYSRAALLEESFKRDQAGTLNSYASQGQLYGGAYGRMQGENTRNYSIGFDSLNRDYQDAKFGLGQDRAQAYADFGSGVTQARYDALIRAFRGGR